jgi:hypothetical protein
MPLPSPVLDHAVIDVRERMDEAARVFAGLGFTLTPRGYHTLGSMNHLMLFGADYLELLGFADGGTARPELAPFPIGLNGLVFKTDDADRVYAHAAGAGLPILPVQSFSRPLEIEGRSTDARFRTTRLDPRRIAMGRIYFCEHQTPELVWRPEWQTHPNGARAISRIVIATGNPAKTAALFVALFGADAVSEESGRCVVTAATTRVELMPPVAIGAEFGDAAPEPSGRAEYLAAIELKVASVEAAAGCLRQVAGIEQSGGRVVVPAREAFNTTLVFAT